MSMLSMRTATRRCTLLAKPARRRTIACSKLYWPLRGESVGRAVGCCATTPPSSPPLFHVQHRRDTGQQRRQHAAALLLPKVRDNQLRASRWQAAQQRRLAACAQAEQEQRNRVGTVALVVRVVALLSLTPSYATHQHYAMFNQQFRLPMARFLIRATTSLQEEAENQEDIGESFVNTQVGCGKEDGESMLLTFFLCRIPKEKLRCTMAFACLVPTLCNW